MPTTRLSAALAAFFLASTACRADTSPAADDATRFAIQDFQIEGNSLVGTDELKLRLAAFVGEQQSIDDLLAARAAISAAYQEAGRPMVAVGLPREFGNDGTVRFKVLEIPVREIAIEGNSRLSEAQIRARLPALTENESPAMDEIARQLALANDNPALELRIDFLSRDDLAADARIEVKERSPLSFAVSADNSGTPQTGRTRLGFSATDADLFGFGDVANLSYVMSPEKPDRVVQLAATYLWPLPGMGDSLIFSGSYSNIDSGRIGDAFNVAGRGSTLGARYQHNLVRTVSRRQTLDAGIESRHYRSIQDWYGIDVGQDVWSRPLLLAYGFSGQEPGFQWAGNLTYAHNLPGGHGNNDTAYANLGTKADWSAWRFNGRASARLPGGFVGQLSGEAQYASDPLIPGEQFGLGGARSVRGFDERALSGDRGWRCSLEIATPNVGDLGRLAVFADRGGVTQLSPQSDEVVRQNIASWGLGWRFSLSGFTAIADWARVVEGTDTTGKGHQKLHLQAVFQF